MESMVEMQLTHMRTLLRMMCRLLSYFARYNVRLDKTYVLPVLHALQGHPESGRLWEEHTNMILELPELGF